MSKKFLNGIDLQNQRIINLADPSANTDAVNKQYVDSALAGLQWKAPVRAATTANITLSAAQTIDGVSVVAGDRVLVKDQTDQKTNGIYVVATGAWTRATDADTAAKLLNASVMVSEGTVNQERAYTQAANAPITVGTTNLTFVQFNAGGGQTYAAGNGLTLTGNTFAVGAGNGITVTAGQVSVNASVVARKFSQAVGDGTSLTAAIPHNLGTRDVVVSVQNATTYEAVETDWVATDTNTVTLSFAVAPTTGQYRVVVIG